MDKKLFTVNAAPHLHSNDSVPKIMWSVVIALMPAFIYSVYLFGKRSIVLTLVAIISALISEFLMDIFLKRKTTIWDGSAVITGILLAFNLPPDVPIWLSGVGASFGVIVGKQIFGGLGNNIFNPALVGRVFLMASWPVYMTTKWTVPYSGNMSIELFTRIPTELTVNNPAKAISMLSTKPPILDAISSATPLTLLKKLPDIHSAMTNYSGESLEIIRANINNIYSWSTIKALFIGNVGGCIGETSALLLLIGGIFLIYKKYIHWEIPLSYIGTTAFIIFVMQFFGARNYMAILYHIFSGGLFLGAFFMATDMVTSPMTFGGRWIFGIGMGIITVVIRLYGGYPEGVSYSILLMNATVPLIDNICISRKNRAVLSGE